MNSFLSAISAGSPSQFRFDRETTPFASVNTPIIGAVSYLVVIFALQKIVKKPMNLKWVEVVHNSFLILLSFSMCSGAVLGMYERIQSEGLSDGLLCGQRTPDKIWDGTAGFWTYIFYLSKYYELIDTVILCLKKKTLITLHVWHHTSMLFVVWSWLYFPWLEGSLWCTFANSLIHTGMYTYYLKATLGEKVWWKKYMTSAQIVQFISGLVVVAIFAYMHSTKGCSGNPTTGFISTAVNCSFLTMFGQFYKKSYTPRPAAKKAA
jgi:fatty acid elongase 3